jgi:PAS domain S-box-containing protein
MQFITLGFFTTAFLWFVSDYTRQKPQRAIYAFSAFYLLAVLIQIVDRSNLTWIVDRPAIKEILLPFGLEITYYEVTLGPFTTFQSLMGMVAATYIVWNGVRFYQHGSRREAAPLLLALGFMYAASVNDTAVSNGLYQFVYAIEYVYLAMILLMAYSLSNTVVEAAMAKEALREKTEELDRFFTVTLDLLCIADTDGYFRRLNPQWEVVLGYLLTELEGQRFLDLVHPDDQASTQAALGELSAHKAVLNFVNRYRCKDGSYRWIEWRSYPAENLVYAAAHDITERKQAEEEIRRLNAELEQRVSERTEELQTANKELESFAYSVSHDLRAPLRAIDGYTRILIEDYEPVLDAEGQRVCTVIRDNTQRMSQLIDDLLAFSRLSRTQLRSTAIDMTTLVKGVFEELMTPEGRSQIDFHLDPLPPAVGDPTLIRQVWINLLSNAIKFSAKRERAIIEVSGRQDDIANIYFVRDNGAGFDPQYTDKLFGVFQRLHSEREFAGTGVGLAIVQRIIHRHGGRVWAESELDQGATFYFTLPRKGD